MGTYLAKDMHPLAAVEGSGFLHMMEVAEPRFTVPCRKYFSKTVIPAMYSQEKEKVQRSLDEVTFCSTTTDLWTAQHQNKSYISLTAHFVDADWVMQTRCLETREMPVAHNAENIADELDQEMREQGRSNEILTGAAMPCPHTHQHPFSQVSLHCTHTMFTT